MKMIGSCVAILAAVSACSSSASGGVDSGSSSELPSGGSDQDAEAGMMVGSGGGGGGSRVVEGWAARAAVSTNANVPISAAWMLQMISCLHLALW